MVQSRIHRQNTHKLLHSKPHEYMGIKTGITSSAGPCLSSCLTLGGRLFLIVVLNCARVGLRFKETEVLKNWLLKHEGIGKTSKGSNLKVGQSMRVLENEGSEEEEEKEDEEND
jgi:D-alanyl-D-alanine carboxypeptidase